MSKKVKLILINIISVLLIFGAFMFEWAVLGHLPHNTYWVCVLVQCGFTFMTLIVYYLSIVADALNKKYREREEKDKK